LTISLGPKMMSAMIRMKSISSGPIPRKSISLFIYGG
jgi:hypothetical protein